MKKYKAGDKVRIIAMPDSGKHFIGMSATVMAIGGLGVEEDDVMIKLDIVRKSMLVSEDQLVRIEVNT